ncbi:MAG: hypothetical protein ACFFBD_24450 [Candidatus Hodarchaeota archaeon]
MSSNQMYEIESNLWIEGLKRTAFIAISFLLLAMISLVEIYNGFNANLDPGQITYIPALAGNFMVFYLMGLLVAVASASAVILYKVRYLAGYRGSDLTESRRWPGFGEFIGLLLHALFVVVAIILTLYRAFTTYSDLGADWGAQGLYWGLIFAGIDIIIFSVALVLSFKYFFWRSGPIQKPEKPRIPLITQLSRKASLIAVMAGLTMNAIIILAQYAVGLEQLSMPLLQPFLPLVIFLGPFLMLFLMLLLCLTLGARFIEKANIMVTQNRRWLKAEESLIAFGYLIYIFVIIALTYLIPGILYWLYVPDWGPIGQVTGTICGLFELGITAICVGLSLKRIFRD